MKKTKVMRLLSLLLVMTLISTCAISGTFAKYVTRAEGEDQARVAKWGVLRAMPLLISTKLPIRLTPLTAACTASSAQTASRS